MLKNIIDKCKRLNTKLISSVIYYGFFIAFFVVTVLICRDAPVQNHFNELAKLDAWFGENWSYAAGSNIGDEITANNDHYLRLEAQDGTVVISKTIDFTPKDDEYLCYRTKGQDTAVYINGELAYLNQTVENHREYTKQIYQLHQVSMYGVTEGDVITIEIYSEGASFFNLQFVAIGDRYALSRYIIKESMGNLVSCLVALVLLIICIVTSRSPILTRKDLDSKALNRLSAFLTLAVVYLAMDSGCMELFLERTAVVSWFDGMSLLLLPIPFLLFTKNAFFPGHKRYDILAFAEVAVCIIAIISYSAFAASLVTYFIYMHIVIGLGVIACIMSFIEERMRPSAEIIIGYSAIVVTAFMSIFAYWTGVIAPASVFFGVGILVFSTDMLVWIIRNRYEMNSMRNEADHILAEREKLAAEEASEQKSRFLSHMSHEIRTPLNAMLGMNELIMHETDISTIRRYTDNIQSAGRTLLALINDVLDFSKIENGKVDIAETDYSLSSVLNDVVLMVQTRADSKGLELKLDVDAQMPDMLRGDEIRVKQIILNLMTNAAKYTNEGWIKLSVRTKTEYLGGDSLVLFVQVSDSGIGIKDEEKPKLFKEFERLDQQRNRSVEGSGLGLSISSRLVQYMNGKISVESVYGKGSTFTLEIPQKVVSQTPIGDYRKRFGVLSNNDAEKLGEERQDSLENMRFTGKTLLAVDDNEMNLEVIASILEMLDITVDRAGGGAEAINRLDRKKYDLILTDDMMPDIDGKQVLSYLKTHNDCINSKTPITVLTANAVSGARDEYTQLGFDAYLTKPIDVEVLQKILIKYLK